MNQAAPEGERLQKILARAGFGSRRTCDELIDSGRVSVNGAIAIPGRRVVERDEVRVDGIAIGILPDLVYYLLNKPAGVITSASDQRGRTTVIELVPGEPRVFAVGRLDLETEGLLILTNDGVFADQLAHPSHGVEKEYLAEVKGDPGPLAIRQLREGVEIEPGVTTAPAKVSRKAAGVLKIVIHEGRNRQVRKMCSAVGYPVVRLIRTRIGPITDQHLAPGQWRSLSIAEVRALSSLRSAPPRGERAAR